MALGFNKFMNRAKSGLRSFAGQAGTAITKGARFLGEKALPVIEKVASGVATAAKYAAPALAFTPLAEFAPLVAGAGLAAGAIARGASIGRSALSTAKTVVDTANSLVKNKTIERVGSLAGNVAPQVMDSVMKVAKPAVFRRIGM